MLPVLRLASDELSTVDAGLLEAEEAGLVVVDGERIDFVHPLMRSTVYWSASSGRRQAVHARLAEVTLDLGGTGPTHGIDGDGPGSEPSVDRGRAAGQARRRGAPLAAAQLWELSADLTPPEDEALLCGRRRSAALERFDAGDVRTGRAMLETLIGAPSSRREQALARLELAFRSWNDVDRVDELIRTALPDIGDDEIFLPVAHANLAWVALSRVEPSRASDHARAAVELAEHGRDRSTSDWRSERSLKPRRRSDEMPGR